MNWGNHGYGPGHVRNAHNSWQIDHIQPIASFNLPIPGECEKRLNWKNLEPLWASENMSKGSKWFGQPL